MGGLRVSVDPFLTQFCHSHLKLDIFQIKLGTLLNKRFASEIKANVFQKSNPSSETVAAIPPLLRASGVRRISMAIFEDDDGALSPHRRWPLVDRRLGTPAAIPRVVALCAGIFENGCQLVSLQWRSVGQATAQI